ncbi:formate/nitrite transporter family protein [Microbacterium sp. zg.Y1090]|uniref:formate/nitrite transporter family protein n=1 Tax=Microbacterium TaxID=33882 RepID=UPI00214C1E99|nr:MULTISPECIES: formate/nitrite transporter family protein [unclassified Microbacterium]MCR2812020.1 formate/nitrite transporter family protein [Microbacterium sp. zg.Y1084]MCR2818541.1 formate/nitrite transporter family protein [Microbacterium sp. zg.Y1090]MDL5486354.1 formate/nitrite transporter family protein [Microbacterium sp. zg-Y1211]WIM29546.1 formate/nitrite transporter family protein [Microbacterium sp. zg-Y1090]
MLTVAQALEVQREAARHKVQGLRAPARFAVSGMLAGAYLGIGVVLMISTAGPLSAAGSGAGRLVSGLVFAAALTLVVFAGGELATSSMMTLTQGALMRAVGAGRAAAALAVTFVANLAGAVVFSIVVAGAGILHAAPAAEAMLAELLAAKAGELPHELFLRGVLCNVLVCLAIWMCARLTTDGPKIAVILLAILAFVASGFEHVVANMTTYALGMLTGVHDATWAAFGANMLWVGFGNLVGGALIVGAAYWFIGGSPRVRAGDARAQAAGVSAADDSLSPH